MKYFSSIWWPFTVGVVYLTTFILLGANMFTGIIFISALTVLWVTEKKLSGMWRKTAYEIAGE